MGLFDFVANAMTEDKTLSGPDSTNLAIPDNGAEGLNAVLQSLAKASSNQGGDNSTYGRMSPLGLDAVIQDWVRQQFIYRRSILQDLFIMAFQVTEIRSAILSIKREVFRKGFSEWQQKFARKCVECGKEYDDEDAKSCTEEGCYKYEVTTEERYDPESGNRVQMRVRKYIHDEEGKRLKSDTVVPDPAQQTSFSKFVGDANTFHQSLLQVLNEFMTDVLIADDGFLLLNKEYIIDNETGEISQSRVFEITRLHPALVEYDIDRKDGLPERSHWLCPIHRNQQIMTGPGFCNVFNEESGGECGGKLAPALFRYYWRGRYRYYLRDEILHQSYFDPSKTYGYSPVLTVFEKVLTLLGIDRWYYRYFYERRIPPGIIITYTDDPESLESEIERIRMKMLDDPNTFPWVAASARTSRGKTDHIKLGFTFEEMDSVSIRQEIRERVAMLWGVTPMHQGDTSSVGGLTRETAQTSMFENLIESYQGVINDGAIPFILKALGVTDWTISVTPPKEKTAQETLELEKMTIENATAMSSIGYKPVKIPGKTIRFTFEEMPGGMMPGGPGGGAGGMGAPGQDALTQGEAGLPPPPPAENEDDEGAEV